MVKTKQDDPPWCEPDPEWPNLPGEGKPRGRPPGSLNRRKAVGRTATRLKYEEKRPKRVRRDQRSYYRKKK